MSELLEEAKKRLEQAKRQRTRNSHKSFDYGVVIGWKAAVTLIIKHEQPKLTEKQEEILKTLRRFYKDSADMLSAIYDTINTTCFNSNDDFIPALRKFLTEVSNEN